MNGRTTASWGIRAGAAVAAFSAAIWAIAARGQEPRSFQYTDFANPADADSDRWWRRYWGEEREVALQQPSFTAHFTIQRDASQQAFGIFYSPRVCEDLRTVNGATLSRCPARFSRFFRDGKLPEVANLPDYVCVVRVGDTPPPAGDIGWNATQATLRTIDGQHVLILSAVLAGELMTECTRTIPLGPPA